MHPPRVGTPPVVGSRRPRAQVRRCKLICWDLGGQAALRAIWEKYYSEAHGLIYVVDAADTERIDESRNVRAPPAASPAPPPPPPPPEEPRAAALRKLAELGAELDEIRPGSFEPRVVEELVTRLLCRIDAVDTVGDAELRGIRRDLVRRAEARSAAP